ncbi:pyruvate ferredoxin oxidoreductase [Candidatus Woesearchaeota archaeon CG11_big_fil_rev_8_21_14_0_20_43_8]|nr:MAG: pyruvate ferredoxin oxidoreductase [Candidatus Woesearchaeota archaeon CG11_big_fil_rev_8_21_14_0_20_43_8]PIO04706.1 MAG: pyruvate ferredoxin oxidoreductase [Candidatus Woesearchaeota archaeon CG08_land_8_20_14_0_20_43_7]
MFELRIHGRGGQGAVVASKILANAMFLEGKYVQSFPMFGVERRGAPVQAFLRADDKPIRIRCQVYTPNHIIVLDPTLINVVDVTKGLKKSGWIIINSSHDASDFKFKGYKVATIDANKIAVSLGLGSKTAPIVNTAILGAFSKITGLISIESILKSVSEEVPIKVQLNKQAVQEAYDQVRQ